MLYRQLLRPIDSYANMRGNLPTTWVSFPLVGDESDAMCQSTSPGEALHPSSTPSETRSSSTMKLRHCLHSTHSH